MRQIINSLWGEKGDSPKPKRGEKEAQSLNRRRQVNMIQRFATIAVLGGTILGGMYFWQSGALSDWLEGAGQTANAELADVGLKIETINIEGQKQVALDEIRTALGVRHGQSIMAVDLKGMKERLDQLPWIEDAKVSRMMPDTLQVKITEHQPAALWQINQQFWIITREGRKIINQRLAHFSSLPMVVGCGADLALADLLDFHQEYGHIFDQITSATRVGDRRWDLVFDDGLTVRMPEKGRALAWQRLDELFQQKKLPNPEIMVVDFRQKDKTVVRLMPDAAERRRVEKSDKNQEEI